MLNNINKYFDYKNKYLKLKLLYNKKQNGGFWNVITSKVSNLISSTLPLIEITDLIKKNKNKNKNNIKNVYILTNNHDIIPPNYNSAGNNYRIIKSNWVVDNLTTYAKHALDYYVSTLKDTNKYTKNIHQKYKIVLYDKEIIFHFEELDDDDNDDKNDDNDDNDDNNDDDDDDDDNNNKNNKNNKNDKSNKNNKNNKNNNEDDEDDEDDEYDEDDENDKINNIYKLIFDQIDTKIYNNIYNVYNVYQNVSFISTDETKLVAYQSIMQNKLRKILRIE